MWDYGRGSGAGPAGDGFRARKPTGREIFDPDLGLEATGRRAEMKSPRIASLRALRFGRVRPAGRRGHLIERPKAFVSPDFPFA